MSTSPGLLRKNNPPKPVRPRKPKLPSAPFPRYGRSERKVTIVRAMTAKLSQANFCTADMIFFRDDFEGRSIQTESNVRYALHYVKYELHSFGIKPPSSKAH